MVGVGQSPGDSGGGGSIAAEAGAGKGEGQIMNQTYLKSSFAHFVSLTG